MDEERCIMSAPTTTGDLIRTRESSEVKRQNEGVQKSGGQSWKGAICHGRQVDRYSSTYIGEAPVKLAGQL